jgi:indolepyruvate ferredoxin oxidoreductase beta subunit
LVNAPKLAEEAGSPLTQNVVLLGALAATKILPIDINTLASSIRELVPRKYLTANLKAFSAGFRSLHLKEK